ncbi:MAG: hypothetical protein KME40_16735 [Komarekiella atlantica HA4396-MV6]|nr:hypothetical protein [Komarekiella atlantica HA4396-MV6]
MTTIATKIALSVIGATGISFLSLTPARAVILVEPIVTTVNEDILKMRDPRSLGPDIHPGEIIRYGVPDRANNLLNATGRDIASLVFELETLSYSNPDSTPAFDNEPVEWGDVNGDGKIGFSNTSGLEDIFANVTIKDNVITYSGGVIPNNTVFYNLFSSQPNLSPGGGIIPAAPPLPADQDGPIRVNSYYNAVPEPTDILGTLAFGVLVVAFKLKRKLK